jgi:hypothetical protein
MTDIANATSAVSHDRTINAPAKPRCISPGTVGVRKHMQMGKRKRAQESLGLGEVF